MSQIHKVFLGAIAMAATLGAVQLASGHDLADRWQAVADLPSHSLSHAPAHNVNRAGKADRIAELKPAAVPTRTVSMRLNDLAATSVLLRVPAAIETGNAKPPALLQNQKKVRTKPTIACEPMVSSLTEVAKLLQPGRCVT
ncbi:hypothetical protein C7U92_17475 [Bradyrhizobium sp. WBOS7]|uniref:Uncharacterized protein n=1 Tax=Bradyrhizobium betae TaxID=244734 RepID=A0AAE9SQM0_9BRAD|nr:MULTISPECIES: hypothetical protein [Bradyrhizobium]MDD1570750.1 hypothetical protein [Bradyrhizobium sp. WBOS1]UUO34805.1 hypothetical protein DCK84_09670 [Bradyrhizobium sp. WBOS01]MDD1527596.1 hypothetical protein [Bradyrhizobium sp. WBOS2]MDD1578508.1 hypothetical protein [Bradyrhizobium sp. WBOS7]MDD1601231.1 hypothetical protein [Bradyrhizobium sp. WBOS16]